jgi:V8-like Glu-specific endopeptidase
MTYKTIIVVCFYCFLSVNIYSQSVRHPVIPENGFCDDYKSGYEWQDIIDKSLLKSAPFNKILHLSFKRKNDIKHYGTASFVSKDLLMTARHVVAFQEILEYIELNIPSSKNQWVRLDKKDYEIYCYTEHFKKREDDIALLRIINKQKLKQLYSGHFEVADSISSTMNNDVNLTGFPFIKFAINSTAPDTLVNRSLPYNLLELNTSKTLVGLPICTCSGDSGAPIWISSGDQYFILGVCEGSGSNDKELGLKNPNLNIGILINNDVVKWIRTIEATSL